MTTPTTLLLPGAAAIAFAALALTSLTTLPALAQPVRMVADINTTTTDRTPSSPPLFVGGDNQHAVIVVQDVLHGFEPWITDGTPEGTHLIADIVPGPDGDGAVWLGHIGDRIIFGGREGIYASDPPYRSVTFLSDARMASPSRRGNTAIIPPASPLDDLLVFGATSDQFGAELWVTGGTPETTRLLRDLKPGADSSYPREFVAHNGVAYFSASTARMGLWRTDGTEQGTYPIDEEHILLTFAPAQPTPFGEHLYYIGRDRFYIDLWRTDGSPGGGEEVHQKWPTTAFAELFSLTPIGDHLFFYARDGAAQGLYSSTGGPDAPRLLYERSISSTEPPPPLASTPNGVGYFGRGSQLWCTDGTEAGTRMVFDVAPGTSTRIFPYPIAAGNTVFFTSQAGAADDPQLWSSDGTPEGTISLGVFDINMFQEAAAVGETLIFRVGNSELWASDGTGAGTRRIADFRPHSLNAGSFPESLTPSLDNADSILFAAFDGVHGVEPWRADAHHASLIADIHPGQLPSSPRLFTATDSLTFFIADDGVHGRELWRLTDDASSPILVHDIFPGATGSDIRSMVSIGHQVVFDAKAPVVGIEPWVSAGDATSTSMISETVSGDTPFHFTLFESHALAYFSASGYIGTTPLLVTDGDTIQVAATTPGASVSLGDNRFLRIGDRLLFGASTVNVGVELWTTPPGSTTAFPIRDPDPDARHRDIAGLVQFNDAACFTAATTIHGDELWVSDATIAGTRVIDILPGPASSHPRDLASADSLLFFSASTPGHGRELWVTDGAAGGTRMVADINPGPASSTPLSITRIAPSRVVFAAFTPESGAELWESDGTPEGTRLVADILPGPLPAGPANLLPLADRVYFSADDNLHGRELWVYEFNAPAPTCPCDWNASGDLNSTDFFDFLTAFFNADADFDNSGHTDSNDFFAFVTCFFEGCP